MEGCYKVLQDRNILISENLWSQICYQSNMNVFDIVSQIRRVDKLTDIMMVMCYNTSIQFEDRYLFIILTFLFQILRDLFHYKPPITKDQFFNSGFVERKIIMCTEVMKLIQQKNKSLQPPRKSNSTSTSNLAQVISTKVRPTGNPLREAVGLCMRIFKL